MSNETRVAGSTTIAPEVIETIIRMTALETQGVSRILISNTRPPVRISIEGQTVHADVYVVLDSNQNILSLGKKLQENISRAILETIGMNPGLINIHIDDIDFPSVQENEF